jgi:hypothetical protein
MMERRKGRKGKRERGRREKNRKQPFNSYSKNF